MESSMATPTKLMAQRPLSTSKSSTGLAALDELSNPPTREEMAAFRDLPMDELPQPYYRNPFNRIYVNRDIRCEDTRL